jgi:hypothetical protein
MHPIPSDFRHWFSDVVLDYHCSHPRFIGHAAPASFIRADTLIPFAFVGICLDSIKGDLCYLVGMDRSSEIDLDVWNPNIDQVVSSLDWFFQNDGSCSTVIKNYDKWLGDENMVVYRSEHRVVLHVLRLKGVKLDACVDACFVEICADDSGTKHGQINLLDASFKIIKQHSVTFSGLREMLTMLRDILELGESSDEAREKFNYMDAKLRRYFFENRDHFPLCTSESVWPANAIKFSFWSVCRICLDIQSLVGASTNIQSVLNVSGAVRYVVVTEFIHVGSIKLLDSDLNLISVYGHSFESPEEINRGLDFVFRMDQVDDTYLDKANEPGASDSYENVENEDIEKTIVADLEWRIIPWINITVHGMDVAFLQRHGRLDVLQRKIEDCIIDNVTDAFDRLRSMNSEYDLESELNMSNTITRICRMIDQL